jgi:xanthine dehydrogenase accessory factor
MREVLPELLRWWEAGETVGMGTVVATFRSAPRPPGASMLVGPDGAAVGSVSGGCVEGAVYELAQEVVGSGAPVLQRYGVSDDDAFAVGLTCGGILDVYVEKVSRETFPELGEIAAAVERGEPIAIATVVEHPDPSRIGRRMVVRPAGLDTPSPSGSGYSTSEAVGGREAASAGEAVGGREAASASEAFGGRAAARIETLGSSRIDDAVRDDALGLLASGHSATLGYGPDGERRGEGMRVFVWAFAPAPRMLVFGAIDFAAAVARVGSFLGYHVTVCDARPVFATNTRFPEADEVVVEWPHRYLAAERAAGRLDERTVVTVLTHDPKFDVPLLEEALRTPGLAYIGAMGSRRTHDDRMARLREAGLTEDELARLSSPIGLDLGARTPEETAISIAAEIVAGRWGGSGEPLAARSGRIHGDPVGSPLRTGSAAADR